MANTSDETNSGKSFIGKLIHPNGAVEEVELVADQFFLDQLIESELKTTIDMVDFHYPKGHAVAYDVFALAKDKEKNGTASAMCGCLVYGIVLLIPRQYIRESK